MVCIDTAGYSPLKADGHHYWSDIEHLLQPIHCGCHKYILQEGQRKVYRSLCNWLSSTCTCYCCEKERVCRCLASTWVARLKRNKAGRQQPIYCILNKSIRLETYYIKENDNNFIEYWPLTQKHSITNYHVIRITHLVQAAQHIANDTLGINCTHQWTCLTANLQHLTLINSWCSTDNL